MKRWIETQGQKLCTWLAVMRVHHGQPWGWLESIWIGIWWRYYCPRPVIDDWTARACVNSGNCGCNNLDRYSVTRPDRESPISSSPADSALSQRPPE